MRFWRIFVICLNKLIFISGNAYRVHLLLVLLFKWQVYNWTIWQVCCACCLYRYICQFVLTILLLIFWPTNGLSSLPYVNTFVSFMRSVGAELFSRTKQKDDEEDGEYDMVWDAEGSMHLVKKAVSRAPIANSKSRTTGRYVLLGWCFQVLRWTENLIVSDFLTERNLISMAEEMLLQGQ